MFAVSSKALFMQKEYQSNLMLDTNTQSMLDLVYVPLNIPLHIACHSIIMNTRLYLSYTKQKINELSGCPLSLLGLKRQDIRIKRVKNSNSQLFKCVPNLKEIDNKVVWIMHRESECFLLPDPDDELRLISFKTLWKIQNKIFIDSSIPEEISSSSHENYFSK